MESMFQPSDSSASTQTFVPILPKEDTLLRDDATSPKSAHDLQVKMVQCTGSLLEPLTHDDFLHVYDRSRGDSKCTFWKPGRLGTEVDDPLNDKIGSIHIHRSIMGITVSLILFCTGKFKLSLGRGLEQRSCSIDDVRELAECILFRVAGRYVETFQVHLISAMKLYQEIDSVYAMQNVMELSGSYAIVRRPHFHESGRVCAVRGYIDPNSRANVSIDHGGWAHFTGFKTASDLLHAEETFHRCMDQYRCVGECQS